MGSSAQPPASPPPSSQPDPLPPQPAVDSFGTPIYAAQYERRAGGFPETYRTGVPRSEGRLRVARIGSSSVRYEVGLFLAGEPLTAAKGHFIHVYVERANRRPSALPGPLRAALERIAAA